VHVNSVLIEGTVETKPVLHNGTLCTFILSAYRKKEKHCFSVEAPGRLGRAFAKYADKGKSVRIVGALINNRVGVVICAEHIEIRYTPGYTENQTTKKGGTA